jgi:hypothetical protein
VPFVMPLQAIMSWVIFDAPPHDTDVVYGDGLAEQLLP